MQHALLKNGVVVNVVEAPEDWTPPAGHTAAPYNPATHQMPAPPAPPRTIDTWQFFALFAPAEMARYFAASEAGNVAVNALREMLWLNAGGKLEGTHPMIQAGLATLRAEGVIDSDARRDQLLAYLAGA